MLAAGLVEGEVVIGLCAISASYILLPREPLPVLIAAEPHPRPWLHWPDRFRPGHHRAAETAGEEEADTFIQELRDAGEGVPQPGPGPVHSPPGQQRDRSAGRHRAPGPPNQKIRKGDLPSSRRTVPVVITPGKPPWPPAEAALQAGPQLAAEPAVTHRRSHEPRPYTGPDQEDPPTSVWSVREVLDSGLGDYLNRLPRYTDEDGGHA